MRATVADGELFDGGPPLGSLKALGFVRPEKRHVGHRALASIIVGWLPLALLAAAQELAYADGSARAFFTDLAVQGRFLIALPLLILAEADVIERLGRIARHFDSAGFVSEQDRERYDDATGSTRRLLDSRVAELGALLLAYAVVYLVIRRLSTVSLPAWQWSARGSSDALSLAGWWHWLVSIPLMLLIFWGWLWRLLLWSRFLIRMARLKLRLIPSHPDGAGGLMFVGSSVRGYRLLTLAIGTIVASTEINLTLRSELGPLDFRNSAIGLAVFVVLLVAGPLLVFSPKLLALKRQGVFKYGALGSDVGSEFEQKWLDRSSRVKANALETGEFSAMADLYQVISNVYEVKAVPFSWTDLIVPLASALLPFVPLLLMAVPLKEIVEALTRLLL